MSDDMGERLATAERERDEARAARAAEPARIAAAVEARDVRTVRVLVGLENVCDSAIAARDMAASAVLGCSIPRAREVLGAAVDPNVTDADIAAAIRAARGESR